MPRRGRDGSASSDAAEEDPGTAPDADQAALSVGTEVRYDRLQAYTGPQAVGGSARPRPETGSYQLDGSTLELRHDDGRVERRAFLWGDRENKTSLRLDDMAFLRQP